MIDKIGHYALEDCATIHDEEALTALQLTGRTAAKVNECVEEVNKIPANIDATMEAHIKDGTFERQIDEHTAEIIEHVEDTEAALTADVQECRSELNGKYASLETSLGARLNNLLGSVESGTTSMDAEIIDARTDATGGAFASLGEHLRALFGSSKYIPAASPEAPYDNLNTIPVNVLCVYSSLLNVANRPDGVDNGAVITFAGKLPTGNAGTTQMLFNGARLYVRHIWNAANNWKPWVCINKHSFEADGTPSRMFTDVKVAGTTERILISNIRHQYEAFTGFTVYKSNDAGEALDVLCEYVITKSKGHAVIDLYGLENPAKLSLTYDYSNLGTGKRVANTGASHLLNYGCYQIDPPAQFAEYTSISMFRSMCVIGDSYASGEIYNFNADGSYTKGDYYDFSWAKNIERMYGVKADCCSKGGLTTRSWLTSSDRGLNYLKQLAAKDLYVIALGINDANTLGESYIGTIDDIDMEDASNNADTFYGNMGRIIAAVKEHNPNGKIILSTMSRTSTAYDAFNEAIIATAEAFGLPYIVQRDDPFFTCSYYTDKMIGLHPTAPIYAGMAKAITRLIEKAIVNYNDYFASLRG